jgi:hypothetical protein
MKYLKPVVGSMLVIVTIWAGTIPNVLTSDKVIGGCTWCYETSIECSALRMGCTGDFPSCFQVKKDTGFQADCSQVGSPCSGEPAFHCEDYEGYICGC